MDNFVQSYKDLIVWQRSMELVVNIYQITEKFPKQEVYGLTNQMRRCLVSIPSNIAEGRGIGTRKDYIHFLRIALGSSNELQTQLEIARRLDYICDAKKAEDLLIEVIKMLNAMIYKLNYPNS